MDRSFLALVAVVVCGACLLGWKVAALALVVALVWRFLSDEM